MWLGIWYFRFQLLQWARRFKPVSRNHVSSLFILRIIKTDITFFASLSSLGSFGNTVYILIKLCKFLYTAFITIQFQWIKNISINRRAVYTTSRQYMRVDLFYIGVDLFPQSVCLLLRLSKNHSNSACKSDTRDCFFHSDLKVALICS